MSICKKCNEEFVPQKGLKSFCSLKCRNSRIRNEEVKEKIRTALLNSVKYKQSLINKTQRESVQEKLKQVGLRKKAAANLVILQTDFTSLSWERKRKRVLLEQDFKCLHCKISKWLGQAIILEIDHIDGNNKNNERENLQGLCPNCHSLTNTWRGRNKTKVRSSLSDEKVLESLLRNNCNVRQTLLELRLSPKGGNYKRCYRLIKEYYSV